MKRTLSLLLVMVVLSPKLSFSQLYIEPFAGYQRSQNSSNYNMLNTGVQVAFKLKVYEILGQVQRGWPQTFNGVDEAFTTNTFLPLSMPAQKTITTSAFTFAIGHRLKLFGKKTKNSFFLKLYTGLMSQNNVVKYQYDKTNYVILNPDKTIDRTGLFISGGFEYMRSLKNGRLFIDLNFSSPPIGSVKYPISYHLMSPVTLNVGYSIKISKK